MARPWVQFCVLSVIFDSQVILCVTKLGNVGMSRPASALK